MKNEGRSLRLIDHVGATWDLLPLLFLGIVTLLLFASFLFHPNRLIWPRSGLGSDIAHMYWVDRFTLAESINEGYLPLWSDRTVAGHPIASNLGALWLYPLTLLYPVFRPCLALTLFGALHVFLAGVFTYFLIRLLCQASRVTATVGALTVTLMPQLIAHLAGGHLTNLCGLTWMPAILLGAWASIKSRSLLPAILGGGALALQLLTHKQMPISTAYLLFGMLGWHCLWKLVHSGWRSTEFLNTIKRSTLTGSMIAGVAVAVSAAWWTPIVEILPWTARIEFDANVPFWYQIPPGMLLSLFAPTPFQFPEWTIYVGTVPLFLALLALLGERRREAIFLWAAVILSLLIALGDATPVYRVARWLVPGLGYFRTRTRLWFLGGFVIALLASLGAKALQSEKTWERVRRHERKLALASAAYLLAGTIAVVELGILTSRLPVELIRAVGAGILSLAIFWLWRYRPERHRAYQVCLIVILLLDLFPLATEYMKPIDPEETFLKQDNVTRFLSSQPGDFRVYSPHHNLSYALSAELGIESIDGYLGLQLAHSTEIIKAASGCQMEGYAGAVPPCLAGVADPEAYRRIRPNPDLLGLLNVRYVIADFPLEVPDLEPVLVDGEVTVYENRRFLPRAFLVDHVVTVPAGTDVTERLSTIDVAHTALVESGTVPTRLSEGPMAGSVTIESRRSGHMSLAVQSDREALLLYSETWAPGWRATIEGEPTQVIRADGALLGVIVPSGASHVTLDYRPLGWRVGWPISLAAIVMLSVWAGASYIRRRKHLHEMEGIGGL